MFKNNNPTFRCFSQFGLTVDGIRLGFDCCEPDSSYGSDSVDKDSTTDDSASVVDSVRAFTNRFSSQSRQTMLTKMDEISRDAKRDFSCNCDQLFSRMDRYSGWEGSALVQHGSFLTIGCVPLIFIVL